MVWLIKEVMMTAYVKPIALRHAVAATAHATTQYWRQCEVEDLFNQPFLELIFQAASLHRQYFDGRSIQLSTLLSVKTGGCSEDCAYCPQSAHYHTGVSSSELLAVEQVVAQAKVAKQRGASRFCMGAAWRGLPAHRLEVLTEMIREVKKLGLETCGTFGLLEEGMAQQLKAAGLDYYNHNLDTDPDRYNDIIHTRRYENRMDTLGKVRQAGLKICCGGIVGMNETREQRAAFIVSLANLDPQPESVPINQLIKIEGTPLANADDLDWTELVRTIAVARMTMPKSMIRLSAGRAHMDEATQALCFLAGANSIFYGDTLLTADNPDEDADRKLMQKLDLVDAMHENHNI